MQSGATLGRYYMSILAPSRTLRRSVSFLLDGAAVDEDFALRLLLWGGFAGERVENLKVGGKPSAMDRQRNTA